MKRRQMTTGRGRNTALAGRMADRNAFGASFSRHGGLNRRHLARRRVAYTLVEAMVAIVLVSIGVAAVFGGLRALAAAQAKAKTADLLQRLTIEEYNLFVSTEDPSSAATSGDFSDDGYPNITWTADLEATSVTNLDQLTIKVTQVSGSDNEQQSMIGLVYVPATTSTSTTGGATAGAGQ